MLIVIRTVDKHNHIGILLDRTRVTQVGKDRTVVVTSFRFTGQLGQRDDRDFEFFCHKLQSSGNIRDFLLTGSVLTLYRRIHELEIVDTDKSEFPSEAVLQFSAPRQDLRRI